MPAPTTGTEKILRLQEDTAKLAEYFTDSLHIGRKKMNKIEFLRYHTNDSGYVTIRFYSKQNNRWKLKSQFSFEKADILSCNPEYTDFNNDGLNDVTYVSAMAARGANEVRRLFIYDRVNDKLVYIVNSAEYPNLRYNKELHCIDAFLVYGGCSTVFLRLQGNRLKQFASVELSDGLTVTEYGTNGERKILFRDSTNKAGFIRYNNYKPLEESKQY